MSAESHNVILRQNAQQACDERDYASAEKLLKEAAAILPKSVETWLELGHLYENTSQLSEAFRCYERVVLLDDFSVEALSRMGALLHEQGDLPRAERALMRCVQLAPEATRYVALASVQQDMGHFEQAERWYEAALAIDSVNIEARFNLAGLVLRHNRARAIELLRICVIHDPSHAKALAELGFLLSAAIETKSEALDLLARSISFDATDWWPRIYLGNALWSTGDIAGADVQYANATEIASGEAFVWAFRADFLARTERVGEAEQMFLHALRIDAECTEANYGYAKLLLLQERWESAVVYLREVLSTEPGHREALDMLERCERR